MANSQVQLANLAVQNISVQHSRITQTYVTEVPIQNLNITMNDLQRDEFVIAGSNTGDEEERGISPIDHLGICILTLVNDISQRGRRRTLVFQKVAHPRPTRQHQLSDILDDL